MSRAHTARRHGIILCMSTGVLINWRHVFPMKPAARVLAMATRRASREQMVAYVLCQRRRHSAVSVSVQPQGRRVDATAAAAAAAADERLETEKCYSRAEQTDSRRRLAGLVR